MVDPTAEEEEDITGQALTEAEATMDLVLMEEEVDTTDQDRTEVVDTMDLDLTEAEEDITVLDLTEDTMVLDLTEAGDSTALDLMEAATMVVEVLVYNIFYKKVRYERISPEFSNCFRFHEGSLESVQHEEEKYYPVSLFYFST